MSAGRLVVGATLLLAGCISSGPLGQLPPVPEGQGARVVFVRPSAAVARRNTMAVIVDGVAIHGLENGEHVAVTVPAGERQLHVRTWDAMGMLSPMFLPQTLQAEAGRTYYFRIWPNIIGGPGLFDEVTEGEGQALMKDTQAR